jgi:hypothetical protein
MILPANLHRIEFDRPWLRPFRALLQDLSGAGTDLLPGLNRQAQAMQLHNAAGLPLSFVAQACLPPGQAYESFIFEQGRVPSRDNLHDLLNALIWLAFPHIKRALNALQAACIAEAGVAEVRGSVRDALTLFDENAAIVAVRRGARGQALATALRQHDWQGLLVNECAAFGAEIVVVLFGHALLEKLCAPYKAITAHAWLLEMDDDFFGMDQAQQCAMLDIAVAQQLAQNELRHTRCFTPLPVLGVPGWWPQQDAGFYADSSVFRPRRKLA